MVPPHAAAPYPAPQRPLLACLPQFALPAMAPPAFAHPAAFHRHTPVPSVTAMVTAPPTMAPNLVLRTNAPPPPPPMAPPAGQAPTLSHMESPPPPCAPAFGADTTVLQLDQVIAKPEVPLPSEGSAQHSAGACQPCAFFHTKGCGNGKQCKFCHLCPADEKKRRKAEKRGQTRALQSSSD